MKKILSALMVAVFLAGLSLCAEAAERPKGRMMSSVSSMLKTRNDEELQLTAAEKARIADLIRDSRDGAFDMEVVDAFNNYNFGLLANKILGNLYKSHGCLHVSPGNVFLLNRLLPVGSAVEIKPYNAGFDEEKAKDVPPLVSLIDFRSDLRETSKLFAKKADVKTVVYPGQNAYVVLYKGKPYAALSVNGGPRDVMTMYQYRDERGYPVFDTNTAFPTPAGKFYVFKKVENYYSNAYRTETTVPMGAQIEKRDGKWMFEASRNKWKALPQQIADDIVLSKKDRQYTYFDVIRDDSEKVVHARWASNTFGKFPILLSKNMRTMAPELIHTTSDLIVDNYNMLNSMVTLLSAPYQGFDECVAATDSFYVNKVCFEFINDPSDVKIDPEESGNYKLYNGIPLNDEEKAVVPADQIISDKIIRGAALTADEEELLIKEGMASRKGGKFVPDMKKVRGLHFYAYQYVVMLKKLANLYSTIRDNWNDLVSLRTALVNDMTKLSISDEDFYKRFAVELMARRMALVRLTKDNVLDGLSDTLDL